MVRKHRFWTTCLLALPVLSAGLVLPPTGLYAQAEEQPPRPARPHHEADDLARAAPRHPVTPEEAQQLLAVLRRIHPDLARRLEEQQKSNPERVQEMLNQRFPRLRGLLELKTQDPPMFELRVADMRLARETYELAKAHREAVTDDEAKVRQIREQLNQKVAEHFEIRQQVRRGELERLEARIVELREQLQQRGHSSERIRQQRVAQLLGEGRAADW